MIAEASPPHVDVLQLLCKMREDCLWRGVKPTAVAMGEFYWTRLREEGYPLLDEHSGTPPRVLGMLCYVSETLPSHKIYMGHEADVRHMLGFPESD